VGPVLTERVPREKDKEVPIFTRKGKKGGRRGEEVGPNWDGYLHR